MSNPFIGTPIRVQVEGPTEVTAGEEFVYVLRVQDIDNPNPFNPSGVDPSLAYTFLVPSMARFRHFTLPNLDSDRNLVAIIRGIAISTPRICIDVFNGLNRAQGLLWDPPVTQIHKVQVLPASGPAMAMATAANKGSEVRLSLAELPEEQRGPALEAYNKRLQRLKELDPEAEAGDAEDRIGVLLDPDSNRLRAFEYAAPNGSLISF